MPKKKDDFEEWMAYKDEEWVAKMGQVQSPDPQSDRAVEAQYAAQELLALSTIGRSRIEDALVSEVQAEDGTPVDIHSGAGAGLRAKTSLRRTTEDKVAYLEKLFPGKVRTTDKGDILIRKGGKDILFDEHGLTLKDLSDLAGDSPQIAASIAAAVATSGTSFIPQLLAIGAATFGSGFFQDMAVRKMDDQPLRPGEAARARGIEAGVDMALPIAGKTAMAGLRKAISPFGKGAGIPEEGLRQATARMKGRGLPFDASAGQKTGSPTLLGAEGMVEPFGGKLKELNTLQDDQMRAIQRRLLGGEHIDALPSAKEVGDAAVNRLGGQSKKLTGQANALRRTAGQEATDSIEKSIAAVTHGRLNQYSKPSVGAAVRKRVATLRDEFKSNNKTNFAAVDAAVGGEKAFVPMGHLNKAFKEISEKLPQGLKTVPDGAGGQKQVAGVIEELVPVELRKFLGAKGQIPPKMTLSQARQLRSFINDMRDQGAALPGIPDRYLANLSHAVTMSIEAGVKNAPNPDVGKLLVKANRYYRKNFKKFVQPGVANVLKEQHLPGSIGDASVVDSIVGKTDNLLKYKKLLGANSSEYRKIRRVAIDDIIDSSRVDGLNRVGGKEFLAKIRGLDREVRKELFGGKAEAIIKDVNLLRVADNSVEAGLVDEILGGNPSQVSQKLQQALKLEGARDRVYRNRLMKKLFDGDLEAADVDATEFASRFLDSATERQVRSVMAELGGYQGADTKVVSDIRSKVIEQMLRRSAKSPTQADIAARQAGNPEVLLDPAKLDKEISAGGGTKLKAILGQDTYNFLEDTLTLSASRGNKEALAGQQGGLVRGQMRAQLLSGTQKEPVFGRIRVLPKYIQFRVIGRLLSLKPFRDWAGSTMKVESMAKTRTGIMASQPVLRALMSEFSEEPRVMEQIVQLLGMDAADAGINAQSSNFDEWLNKKDSQYQSQ